MAITLSASDVPNAPFSARLTTPQIWGIVLLAPYMLVFAAFVVYPVCYGLWLARHPASYVALYHDPIFARAAVNTLIFLVIGINFKMLVALLLSGFFVQSRAWIRWLSVLFILPWAVPSIPTILSVRFMLNPEWGMVNQLIFKFTGDDGPNWLNDPTVALTMAIGVHIWKSLPFWTLILMTGRLAIPQDLFEAAAVDGASWAQKFRFMFHHLALAADAVPDLHAALDDLDARRFQQRLSLDRRRPCRPHPCAVDAGHSLSQARPARHVDGRDRLRAAAGAAVGVFHDETALAMKMPAQLPSWREVGIEARLLLIGIPVFIWTMIPIYHMFVFAISPKEDAFSGKLWPAHPTLHNFEIVFRQQHYFLRDFWIQFWNSVVIAVAVGALTLLIATAAAFAISRLRIPGSRWVMNLALFTYFIPAAFLAVPMYRTMGNYGLLNNQWSLILAMVTISSPYAIWVLKQASDKLPVELDEAAVMDGATIPQIFRLVYLPLMMPSLVAIGTYALLLAWNEYLYAFLLLSKDTDITLPVALGNFLAADDSPWELLMTTGFIYALPPAAIYYAFRRYMVGGLTAGAVKS
jgi:multiple sugar transport system permease protein